MPEVFCDGQFTPLLQRFQRIPFGNIGAGDCAMRSITQEIFRLQDASAEIPYAPAVSCDMLVRWCMYVYFLTHNLPFYTAYDGECCTHTHSLSLSLTHTHTLSLSLSDTHMPQLAGVCLSNVQPLQQHHSIAQPRRRQSSARPRPSGSRRRQCLTLPRLQ